MKLFSKKKPFPDAKHVIESAFTVGGIEYFSFTDPLNVPYERGLTSLVFYREIALNADHEFLLKHVEAVDKLLKTNPIDIYRVKQLNDLMGQRLKLPKDTELLYKLASVVYFDENESPYMYDFEYAKKKIEHWKKHASLQDFFLQKPLQELIPYLTYAGENLETFSQMTKEFSAKHSDVVSGILSENSKMN